MGAAGAGCYRCGNDRQTKVLIVDDSKLARMAVIKALNSLRPDWTRWKHRMRTKRSRSVKQAAPDFALLDFNMPGKDGLTLAAEIRQLPRRSALQ